MTQRLLLSKRARVASFDRLAGSRLNPTFERNATSGAPRAFARIFFVSRGAAGVVRSTLR